MLYHATMLICYSEVSFTVRCCCCYRADVLIMKDTSGKSARSRDELCFWWHFVQSDCRLNGLLAVPNCYYLMLYHAIMLMLFWSESYCVMLQLLPCRYATMHHDQQKNLLDPGQNCASGATLFWVMANYMVRLRFQPATIWCYTMLLCWYAEENHTVWCCCENMLQ